LSAITFVRPAKHVFVPLDEIDLSHAIRPYNATVVAELAQSIRAIGLQTPLTCVIRDGRHILVTGRNRLEALRLVGAEQEHGAPLETVLHALADRRAGPLGAALALIDAYQAQHKDSQQTGADF
jgi:hypothetical protein